MPSMHNWFITKTIRQSVQATYAHSSATCKEVDSFLVLYLVISYEYSKWTPFLNGTLLIPTVQLRTHVCFQQYSFPTSEPRYITELVLKPAMRCILILNQKTTAPFNAPRSLRSRLCTVILYARIPLCFRYQHQLPKRELNRLQILSSFDSQLLSLFVNSNQT